MTTRDLAVHQRGAVATRSLQQPRAAGWKIANRARGMQPQMVEIDHIQIGAKSDGNASAVSEAIQVGGL